MDGNIKESGYDSDVILINDQQCELITLNQSKSEIKTEIPTKQKKRPKRKVKINKTNNTETLIVKKKRKKQKLRCIININAQYFCHMKEKHTRRKYMKKSNSIVRYEKIVCKKEAYYNRIVPICFRETCFNDKYCRSIFENNNKCKRDSSEDKPDLYSSLSTAALTEALGTISYEEISNGDFSSSTEELDTLIKRTKEREDLFVLGPSWYSNPIGRSTPVNYASDSNVSLHSQATLCLAPITEETYSPITDPYSYEEDYSPIETKLNEDVYYNRTRQNISPSLISSCRMDRKNIFHNNNRISPYSPSLSPPRLMEFNISLENQSKVSPYSPSISPDNLLKEYIHDNCNVANIKKEIMHTCDVTELDHSPILSPPRIIDFKQENINTSPHLKPIPIMDTHETSKSPKPKIKIESENTKFFDYNANYPILN